MFINTKNSEDLIILPSKNVNNLIIYIVLHDRCQPGWLSDAAQMRWRISGEELSADTATSNDGTSLTCSAWLNLLPPPPHSQSIGSPQTYASWLAGTLPSPYPSLAHALHVIIFLFNNQPWKRVGRKTSKYSHSHDSTRHECTAKLSQTALRGGSPDWWGLQQLTARVRTTGTLWSQASSSFLPSTNWFMTMRLKISAYRSRRSWDGISCCRNQTSQFIKIYTIDRRRHTDLTLEATAGETTGAGLAFPSLEKETGCKRISSGLMSNNHFKWLCSFTFLDQCPEE